MNEARVVQLHLILKPVLQPIAKLLEKISGSWTPTMKRGKKSYQYMSINSFTGSAPTFAWLRSYVFLSVRTIKNPCVFSSNWKWRDTPPHLCCLSYYSQPTCDLWHGVTINDLTCAWVHRNKLEDILKNCSVFCKITNKSTIAINL